MSGLDLRSVLIIAGVLSVGIYFINRVIKHRLAYFIESVVLIALGAAMHFFGSDLLDSLGNAVFYAGLFTTTMMVLTNEKRTSETVAFDIAFFVSTAITVGISFLIPPELTQYINASITFLALIPAVIYRNSVRYAAIGVVGAGIVGIGASILLKYFG